MLKKVVLALFLCTGFSTASMAEDNSWLVGLWQLSDKAKVEYLEFDANNKVSLVSGKGRKISGKYKLSGNKVKVVYNFKGKKIPIEMSFSAKEKTLKSKMNATGKTAKYIKNA